MFGWNTRVRQISLGLTNGYASGTSILKEYLPLYAGESMSNPKENRLPANSCHPSGTAISRISFDILSSLNDISGAGDTKLVNCF